VCVCVWEGERARVLACVRVSMHVSVCMKVGECMHGNRIHVQY